MREMPKVLVNTMEEVTIRVPPFYLSPILLWAVIMYGMLMEEGAASFCTITGANGDGPGSESHSSEQILYYH